MVEGVKSVPFDIKRVYYMFDLEPGSQRGRHAHRKLNQAMTCIQGSCTVLLDDGRIRRELVLDRPGLGVQLPAMVWHEMYDITPGAVLVCFADDVFDAADYIHEYEEFRALAAAAG